MLEEDHGTLTGRLERALILAIEHIAQAAVTQILDDGIDNNTDRTSYGTAGISADCFADLRDEMSQLLEKSLDQTGRRIVNSHRHETLLDHRLAGLPTVIRNLVLRHGLHDHGDHTGLDDVHKEV